MPNLKSLIMSGEELKAKLSSWGVNFLSLSKAIGYDCDQRLHQNFKAADVKSGLIERIATALGRTVSELYGEDVSPNASLSIIEMQSKTIESQQNTIDCLTRLLEQSHNNETKKA